MKKSLLLIVACCVSYCLVAQDNDEAILKSVGENMLKTADFAFEGVYNHQTYAKATDIPDTVTVKFKSNYGGWFYVNGVLNMAMLNLSNFLNDGRFANAAISQVNFGLDSYKYFAKRYDPNDRIKRRVPFREIINTRELDDCGAMGASVIEVYKKTQKADLKTYIDKAAKHITEVQDRTADKTLCRKSPNEMTIWADDLYMSVPFLARMGNLSGEKKYFDDAVMQVLNFDKYLWDENLQLYYHCYFTDTKRNGVAHWGRCNGWIMMAQAHLLQFLPKDHPKRNEIILNLEKQIIGVSRYQGPNGLWYQILDKNDSYEESSCTSMFVYCIAKAINEGWIDKRYASIAIRGWEGLKKNIITPEGQMKSVCVGTGIQNDILFYYERPAKTDDTHGTGALIDAGIEVIKLKKEMEKARRDWNR
jgi:rhamnogalacturonyl hydrolase YesR